MKTFILLLAISAIVLTEDRLKTTKAKNEDMTHVLQRLVGDLKVYYGNPFLNGYIPKCRDDEVLDTYVLGDVLLVGWCRPLVKDSDECPAAPSSSNITPNKDSYGNGFSYCYLDCSDSKSSCPTESFCDDNRCSYKQPDQKPYQKPDPTEATSNFEDPYSENKTCKNNGVFSEYTNGGVTYGICDPKVAWNEKCPLTPLGVDAYVETGYPGSYGNKECWLECYGKYNKICPLGSQCISGSCRYLKSPSHRDFNNPFAQSLEHPQCKEADGADAVLFVTTDNKFAGICAPKAPQDIQCPLFDTPENKRRVSLAVKDENRQATHCQLPCDSDTDCAGGSQCLTINDDGRERKICLYNIPVPSKTHDEFGSSYPTADRLMLKPRDE